MGRVSRERKKQNSFQQMSGLGQFDSLIDILKNMPPDRKAKLIHSHQEFHRLKLLCEVKKEIEVLPKMTGIKVLKNTENTKALKNVVDILKPAGFSWKKKKKKL